jgi:L-amino acid N-acyltransferase YncA
MTRAVATIRPARRDDADRLAAIYNQGIEDRTATFETRPRTPHEAADWLRTGLPVLVAELDGDVVGFARVGAYSPRPAYAGVAEHTVYVDREARGHGIGRALLDALAAAAAEAGLHKLTSRVFAENGPSLAMHRAAGFDVVGVHRRHARLDGRWIDCVVVERLVGEAVEP